MTEINRNGLSTWATSFDTHIQTSYNLFLCIKCLIKTKL